MVQAPDLTHALLELGVSKSDDLDEAEARQLIYGGSLELNLLELHLVQEADLLRALGHQSPIPAAASGPLPVERTVSMAVRGVVRDAVAGFAADGAVVVSLPGVPSDEERQSLADACAGRPVTFQLTTNMRLVEALALLDGSLVGRRTELQLARAGLPPAELQDAPPPPERREELLVAPSPDRPMQVPSSLRIDPEPERLPAVPPPLVGTPPTDSSLQELSRLVNREGGQQAVVEHHVAVSSAVTPPPVERASDETAPPPAGYQELARSVIPPPPIAERPTPESVRPTHAPVEPAYPQRQAVLDLSTAKDRDTIVSTICRFCAQYFEYVAIFGIQASEARGLVASGPGKSSARIADLRVPLDVPSALSRVKETGLHRVARLRAGGLEGGLVRDLERPLGRAVLLLPITVQGRTLLMIWADDGADDVDIEHALPALGLMRVAGAALERVLIERKRASRLARPSLVPGVGASKAEPIDAPAPPLAQAPPASLATAEPLARGTKASGAEEPLVAAPPSQPEPAAPSIRTAPAFVAAPAQTPPPEVYDTRPTRLGMSIPPAGVRRMSSGPAPRPEPSTTAPTVESRHQTERDLAPPELRASSPPAGEPLHPTSEIPRKRKLRESFLEADPTPTTSPPASSDPPAGFPSNYPKTMKGYPADIRLKASLSPSPKISAPLLSRRIVTVSEQPRADGASADGASTEAERTEPTAGLASSPPDLAPGDPRTLGTDSPSGGTMMSRRAEVDSPPPRISERPPARPSPAPLSYRALVGQWLDGDDRALARLLEGGESAVGALIAAFPGPVREPSSPQERASECGPVLKAIATIGPKATPFLTVRTADENAVVRRWAVFLLGELPGRDAARAIADRLLDETVDVRRAALASARRVQGDALTRRTLRARLEEMTRDSQLMTDERCAAVEAIADIREYESIPTLLQLLDDESSAVKRAARWGLSVLTRHDFQEHAEKWREFWQRHRNEPRSEWLLLALKATAGDLARAAADEIEGLLGEPVGDLEHLTDDTIAQLRTKLRALPR